MSHLTPEQEAAIQAQRRAGITEAVRALRHPESLAVGSLFAVGSLSSRVARRYALYVMARSVHRQAVLSGARFDFYELDKAISRL
jgi:hypothetical protein